MMDHGFNAAGPLRACVFRERSCNIISIYVKELQFIHTVNGDGSKNAKIIKDTINQY